VYPVSVRAQLVRIQKSANRLPYVADRYGVDSLAEHLKETLGYVVDLLAQQFGEDAAAICGEAEAEDRG